MSKPLVSVIVTTKNESKNISSFCESIKKQTYNPIELIVVDNNSTDNTTELAKKFTDKVYTQGPERSAQRNFGAEKSSGDFLMVLDADMIV
ncbi:MAG: glycosyltransferase, partial [Thermosphaera sp.]